MNNPGGGKSLNPTLMKSAGEEIGRDMCNRGRLYLAASGGNSGNVFATLLSSITIVFEDATITRTTSAHPQV